jgi:pimeloyl-ACP methyl ester carboxylesterase
MLLSSVPQRNEARLVERHALYLELEPDVVRAVLHLPSGGDGARAGIVMCLPFGWEELWLYRAFMQFADVLAATGYPAIRIDLPGSGESGGSPRDPGRFEAWRGAVTAAATHLRSVTGCERVVAFGAGLGGVVAFDALAAGAPIDDLVLWAVPARGRALMRQMRLVAHKVVSASRRGEPVDYVTSDGSVELGGFVLARETVDALEGLDLATVAVPDAPDRRVLMLGRDTLPVDRRLLEHLESAGSEVSVGAMITEGSMGSNLLYPQGPVRELSDLVLGWLAQAPDLVDDAGARRFAAAAPVRVSEHAAISVDGVDLRETQFEFDQGGERIRGVLTEPADRDRAEAPLCGVLLNAGPVRRIGLQRMWVEASRRWAARGVPTLRIDLPGIGESDGDEQRFRDGVNAYYRPEINDQVAAALDALQRAGLPRRFLLAGHCAGANWAFQVSLTDQRVCATALANPGAFYWRHVSLARAEVSLSLYVRRTVQLLRERNVRKVIRLAREHKRIPRVAYAIRDRAGRLVDRVLGATVGTRVDRAFARLHKRGVQTSLVVGADESVDRDIFATGRANSPEPWPGVKLERLPACDHMFVSLPLQRQLHASLDRSVDDALAAAGVATRATAATRGG